jgi:DNA repair exonuclease SbcCD ATPase subunit
MKLEIQSVRVRNFLSFGNTLQDIQFKTGVNMVLGKDMSTGRSNGAGKTSFLETIPYSLYGTTHKDIKKEQLINWKNRKGTEVELTFKKGDINYSISRGIKPDNFEIYENDNLIDRPAHLRDYQKILEEIIGLNFSTFCSLIHSNINSSNRILSMKKPEKRKFIEDVFGLHIYSFINSQANDKIRNTNEKIKAVSQQMDHNEVSIISIEQQINDVDEKIKRLGSSVIELKDAEIKLQEFIDDNPELDNRLHDLEDSLTKCETEYTELDVQSRDTENQLRSEDHKLKELKVKFLKLEESEKYQDKLDKFIFNRGDVDLEAIEKTKTEVEKGNDELAKIEKQLKDADIDIAKEDTQFANQESKLDNLIDHKECPTCGQELKSTDKDVIKELRDYLKVMSISRESKQNLRESLRKNREIQVMNIKHQKELLIELEDTRDTIYKLKDKITVNYDKAELNKEHDEHVERTKSLTSEAGILEENLRKKSNKISLVKNEIQDLKSKTLYIESQKNSIEALKTKIQLEERAKHEFRSIIETHKVKITDLKIDNGQLDKKIRTYNTVIDYLDVIKELCKDENIKQYAISSIMPYLNKQTNFYLSEVGYGFYTVLDRWLDADIKGPGVTNGSYGSLSGGEARGIDLAIQFALLDIARIQAGIWPDILIMDEILDSSVDSKGIGKLMEIIRMKQQQEDNKIFLISHREEIGGEIEPDNTYYITKDRGFSEVKV